ncbi:MAG: DMT family transporter [Candidatus Dormibacteria bacterium]
MVLAAATVAVSFSAIFIRVAGDTAATVVWLRMAIASVVLAPFALRSARRAAKPGARVVAVVLFSGVLLGGHFLLWTASLGLTSVAASVLLVSMHPVVVAPAGRWMLGERVPPLAIAGVVAALAGTVITCAGDLQVSPRALGGDLLALGGAICLAGYLLIGRGVRRSIAVVPYSAGVYAVVSVTGAATAVASGTAHLPSMRTTLACLALAIVCTVGGHTAFNLALRRVPAIAVSAAFLGEPPLTALLALILLASVPPLTTVAGGVLILAGLAATLRGLRSGAADTQAVAALE